MTDARVLPFPDTLSFPDVRSGGPGAPGGRENGPETSPIAQEPAPARAGARGRTSRLPSPASVQAVLSGASVIDSPSPALNIIWARHCAAARFYRRWWARWPGYAYGALHTVLIAAPLYFAVWATDSRPKLLATTAVITTLLWAFRVI